MFKGFYRDVKEMLEWYYKGVTGVLLTWYMDNIGEWGLILVLQWCFRDDTDMLQRYLLSPQFLYFSFVHLVGEPIFS